MPISDKTVGRRNLFNALADVLLNDADAKAFLIDQTAAVPQVEVLKVDEHEFLTTCLVIYRNWKGDMSPAENFICEDLIGRYEQSQGRLTPDLAQDYLEDFRENFDYFISTAQRAVRQFPEIVARKEENG
jgi:hypothetical protein